MFTEKFWTVLVVESKLADLRADVRGSVSTGKTGSLTVEPGVADVHWPVQELSRTFSPSFNYVTLNVEILKMQLKLN